MRVAEIAIAAVVAAVAVGVIVFVFADSGDAPQQASIAAGATSIAPTAVATPAEPTWVDGLSVRYGDAEPSLLSCYAGGDDRITSGDDRGAADGDIALINAGCRTAVGALTGNDGAIRPCRHLPVNGACASSHRRWPACSSTSGESSFLPLSTDPERA
jgi:hypothetical protein